MAEITIGDCSIWMYKISDKVNEYIVEVEEDFGDTIKIKCTNEQINTLGKALVAFAATNRG